MSILPVIFITVIANPVMTIFPSSNASERTGTTTTTSKRGIREINWRTGIIFGRTFADYHYLSSLVTMRILLEVLAFARQIELDCVN